MFSTGAGALARLGNWRTEMTERSSSSTVYGEIFQIICSFLLAELLGNAIVELKVCRIEKGVYGDGELLMY